ncbi:probable myosin-binding protein 4 [Pistacia vera]|uniref:probable myosin-binding protein 4 n=1 Tax=Pistacia vera TaxID=55513 RepID=UPI001263BEE4|nr:probable myosin-binding protein 4 [Pistacia vera]XP_031277870.1 probable myosin-binding protein 4 [Pistacia vera]
MAAKGMSYVKAQRNMQGFTTILTSTACEWVLIFLLLIEAVYSFLLTKFAGYCKLQSPCILCSRLDHVLGNERPEFYRNLICSNHRLEISSLICCHKHGKLGDGCAMCDDCLLSFSTKNNSNLDMHRLLFGKLGFDLVGCGSPSSNPNKDFIPSSRSKSLCSCCNKPWKSRQNLPRLPQLKSPGTRAAKPNPSVPCLSRQDGMKKTRGKFSGQSIGSCLVGRSCSDSLSQIQSSELKIASNLESEFLSPDHDDGNSVIRDTNEAKDDAGKPHDIKCLTSNVSSWHDLAEFNWQHSHQKTYSNPLPELISLDDIFPPSNTSEVPTGISPISQSINPAAIADPVSLVDMNPSYEAANVPVEVPPRKANVTRTTNTQHVPINPHEEILKLLYTTAGVGTKNDQVLSNLAPVSPTSEDRGDVCKKAVNGEERATTGLVALKSIEEHDRDAQNLKLSSAEGINLPVKNMSNNVQGCGDEFQMTDTSSSNGIQTVQKSILAERTESTSLESLDGSTVSEIEGESTIDRLKRQVEYDRKCMNALYKELDEERSASAVAANQAMAMITRLQEEKAALQMDALQYLRMMEEQAEYDLEELEKANTLLAEKDKEIQDLEADLEYYRLSYLNEPMMRTIQVENHNLKKENVNGENLSLNHINGNANLVPCNSMHSEVSKDRDKPDIDTISWSEFVDEKLHILQFLDSLERKFHMFAHEGIVHDLSDGPYSEAAANVEHNQGKHLDDEGNSLSCWTQKKGLSMKKDLPVSNESIPAQERLNALLGEDQVISRGNSLVSNGKQDFTRCRENDLVAHENEISDLSDRLKALKDDCNFLERTFNFLQNGNEGLSFIQEIARQLKEIRRIGIQGRCRSVP